LRAASASKYARKLRAGGGDGDRERVDVPDYHSRFVGRLERRTHVVHSRILEWTSGKEIAGWGDQSLGGPAFVRHVLRERTQNVKVNRLKDLQIYCTAV